MQFLYLKNILNKNIKLKYERLEKLSREVEKQGLSFPLDKDNIYDGVSKSGVKEGTKDGLLKEAGFTNTEREAIKKQEVNEGSKKLEDRAVERMNSAVEKISREFDKIILLYLDLNSEKIDSKQYLMILENDFGISNLKTLEKLENLLDK